MDEPIVEEEVEFITEPWDELDDQTFYFNVLEDKILMNYLKTNSFPMDDDYINGFNNLLLNENVAIDSSEVLTEDENAVQNINTSAVDLQEHLMILKDNIRREAEQKESGKKKMKNDRISEASTIGLTKHINQSIIPRMSTRVSTEESRKAQPTFTSEEVEKDMKEHVSPVIDFISHTSVSRRVQTTSYSEEYEKNMEEQIASVTYSISQSTIPCKTCFVDFSSREDLLYHMTQCHGQKLFECCNCDFPTLYKRSLKDHEKHHSQIKYFECKFCEFSTNNIITLNNHLSIHTGELKPFPCDKCNFRAKSEDDNLQHKKLPSGDIPFCSYRDYKAYKKSNITHHELIHTGERPFSYTLKNHIRKHTGEKPFECHKCSFKTIKRRFLNNHLKRHDSEFQKFSCSKCKQIYFLERHLTNHERICHEEATSGYINQNVNKKIKSSYLEEKAPSSSISTVSPKQEKKQLPTFSSLTGKSKKSEVVDDISKSPIVKLYICSKCSYRCRTLIEVSDHMSSHKESEDSTSLPVITKEYRCIPCNLSFSSRREVKQHLMEKHLKRNREITINIGKYECEE